MRIVFFFTVFICVQSNSQQCGSENLRQNLIQNSPLYYQFQEAIDYQYALDIKSNSENSRACEDDVHVIPTVIHVVHFPGTPIGQGENLSDAYIIAGLDWVTQSFRGMPICDTDPTGNDIGIELCLAKRDINNEPTTGIIRYASNLSNVDRCSNNGDDVKIFTKTPIDPYPSTDYLNIWLVSEICAPCSPTNCDVAGYSTLAASHGQLRDGFVNEANLWYSNNANACHKAKVGVHELGHYFNLYHTFQDGCPNNSCLLDGDKVCDTPPDNDYNYSYSNGCYTGTPMNTCATDADDTTIDNPFTTDVDDLDNNYMDYHPTACSNSFTPGQKARMKNALCNVRNSLLASTGCSDPCPNPIIADFSLLPTGSVYDIGTTVSFINNSLNETNVSYAINGSSIVGNQYTFDTLGVYEIVITASSNDPLCFDRTSKQEIEIVCPLNAVINSPIGIHTIDEVIMLQGSIEGNAAGISYEWTINDFTSINSISNSLVDTYVISDFGWYQVSFIACSNLCCDTAQQMIFIANPCQSENLWFNGSFEDSNDETATGIADCPGNPNRGIHVTPYCAPQYNYPPFNDVTTGLPGGHYFWTDNALTPCLNDAPEILMLEQTFQTSEDCNPYTFSCWTHLPDCLGYAIGEYKVFVNDIEYGYYDLEVTSCNEWAEQTFDFNVNSSVTTVSIRTWDEVYGGYDWGFDEMSLFDTCSDDQPVIDVAVPAGDCAPFEAFFENNSLNVLSHHWNFGDGTISNDASPIHLYSSPGTYQVQYYAESINTCFNTDPVIFTIEVDDCTVPQEPCNIVFDWISLDTMFCEGNSGFLSFSTNASNNSIIETDGTIHLLTSNSFVFPSLTTTTCYTLHLEFSPTCFEDIAFCIHVNPKEEYEVITDQTTYCFNETPYLDIETTFDYLEILDADGQLIDVIFPLVSPLQLSFDTVAVTTCYDLYFMNETTFCDTLVEVCTIPMPLLTNSIFIDLCETEVYELSNGELAIESGLYEVIIPSATSCDSLIIFDLEYVPQSEISIVSLLSHYCVDEVPFVEFSTTYGSVEIQTHDNQTIALIDPLTSPLYLEFDRNDDETCYQMYFISADLLCDSLLEMCFTPMQDVTTDVDEELCNGTAFILPNGNEIYEDGSYNFTFTSANSCDSIVTYTIDFFGDDPESCHNDDPLTVDSYNYELCECVHVFVPIAVFPTAFSPNADTYNDTWKPISSGLSDYSIQIFNRWGELIFEGHDNNSSWDGTVDLQPAEIGVYVFKAEYRFPEETEFHSAKGNITLIR